MKEIKVFEKNNSKRDTREVVILKALRKSPATVKQLAELVAKSESVNESIGIKMYVRNILTTMENKDLKYVTLTRSERLYFLSGMEGKAKAIQARIRAKKAK